MGQGGTGRYHCPPEASRPPCSVVTAVVTPSSGTHGGLWGSCFDIFLRLGLTQREPLASAFPIMHCHTQPAALALGEKNVDNSS